MALAFNIVSKSVPDGVNNEVFGVVDITLDAVYKQTAGEGWEIAPANLGIHTIHNVVLPATSDGFVLEFTPSNGKITVYWAHGDTDAGGPLVEYTDDGAGLSADVIRCSYQGI